MLIDCGSNPYKVAENFIKKHFQVNKKMNINFLMTEVFYLK